MTWATAIRVGFAVAVSATTAIAVAIAASVAHFPLTTQRISVDRGAQLFKRHCATCHAVTPEASSRIGPSLHEIGRLADTRIPGMSAEQYIFQSIVDPNAYRLPGASGDMPESTTNNLRTADLIDITAFLAARGGQVRYRALYSLAAVNRPQHASSSISIDVQVAERGRQLFYGKLDCSKCHSLDSTPGSTLIAPNLARIGLHESAYVRQAVLDPNAEVAAPYVTNSVLFEGRVYSGRLIPSEDDSIRLLCVDTSGAISLHEFDRSELEPLEDDEVLTTSSISSMPSYKTQMDGDELNCLLEFLATLR
jgi:cytochrome c2